MVLSKQPARLDLAFERFHRSWGPTNWRRHITSVVERPDPSLYVILRNLAEIEREAETVTNKLIISGLINEPNIAEFTTTWRAEEADHSRALTALSNLAWDQVTSWAHPANPMTPKEWVSLKYYGKAHRELAVAAYATLGMVQEYIASHTYRILALWFDSASATLLLEEISRQERRHMTFYRSLAATYLSSDVQLQDRCAELVASSWQPPGVQLLGQSRFLRDFSRYFSTPDYLSALRGADSLVAHLPGLSGVLLLEPWLEKNLA